MFDVLLRGPKIDKQKDALYYNYDPAVSGSFFVYFEGIASLDNRIWSDSLNQYALQTNHDARNPVLIQDSLCASCISMDVPDLMLKHIPQSTVQYFFIHIPATYDYGSQTLSIRFYDTSTGLLYRFFRNWLYCLRRPSKELPNKASENDRTLLKCNAICFVTDHSLVDVTFAFGLLGLMPTGLPTYSSATDITSKSIMILQQTFTFDKFIIDDYLYNYVKDKLLPMFISKSGVIQWQYS